MRPYEIQRIGIVGTGVIGASWAAYFLARGFDVCATDPAEGAEERLRKQVSEYWPVLEKTGLTAAASKERLVFSKTLEGAVEGAEFIQENGPERLDLKRDLIARIDAVAPPNAIIATSSSGLLISSIQDAAKRPERVVLGHPFNPPHLIPLVEVVGGTLTAPDVIERTLAFYTSIGKKPIHLRREVKGHIANRLQAALWREALSLVDRGVATVADIDAAISHGPGLRWALLGPFLNLELAGGAGGLAHTLEHLGPPMESWWNDLGSVQLSDELIRKTVEQIQDLLKAYSFPETVRQRDDLLVALLAMKANADQLP